MGENASENGNLSGMLAGLEQRMLALLRVLSGENDRIAMEQLRAALRTAQAVEEMARQGVRLRDQPTAVWGP